MLTDRQLEILQHALGLDKYGRGESRRNHFCAGAGDVPDCAELVAIGYMRTWSAKGYPYFNCSVTDAGKNAVRGESPAPPKLTRSQQRYRRFLNWADAWDGTFREFLEVEKMRRKEGIAL